MFDLFQNLTLPEEKSSHQFTDQTTKMGSKMSLVNVFIIVSLFIVELEKIFCLLCLLDSWTYPVDNF